MNKLTASVVAIEAEKSLHIVSFESHGVALKMMGLELPKGLEVGSNVLLGVKSSHVAIAKNVEGDVSFSNQLRVTIDSIDAGKLISTVSVRFYDAVLQSILTRASVERMKLQKGDQVVILFKASELFVLEVLHD